MSSLPIDRRGNFFQDAYFQDSQGDFENAMDKVMDRFGGRSLLADQFTSCRKLKRDNTEVAGAASISDSEDNYIIILDMSDFLSGSITVSTSGRNAVVEASYETKKFYKKFPLPKNCNLEGVKSAMSNDGILTINAPKQGARNVSLGKADAISKEPVSCNREEGESNNSEKLPKGEITVECLNLEQKADDVSSQKTTPQTPTETRRLSIDRRGNFFQDVKFENIWCDFEKSMENMMQREKNKTAERDTARAEMDTARAKMDTARAERDTARAERRVQRDAIFEKITKQFFEDDFPKKKDNIFDKKTTNSKDNFFDLGKKKQKSFEDELNNIREQFFSDSSSKRKDTSFEEDFARKKEDFFGDDLTRRKNTFFEDDSKNRRDKFFDDDHFKKTDKFFDDDFVRRKSETFDNDSSKKEDILKDGISSTCKKEMSFDKDSMKKEGQFSTGNTTPKEDASRKRYDKAYEGDPDFGFFASDAPMNGRFKKYRNLRNWDPEVGTQAVSVKQSNDSYKILLDAKDVDSNSLSVRAKDDGLVVTGGDGRNAFQRKFSLPGAISFDKVNASLSEDGILVITIPKN